MSKNIIIVGGHGNVSLRLARLLSAREGYKITSIVRNEEHFQDIRDAGALPRKLSLEDDSVEKFAEAFQGVDVVYFSAGAGGKGGPERTKAVDYEGALKVFDAIEMIYGEKPRLILVSAIDVRDPNIIPEHYNDADIAAAKKMREAIPIYFHWKYEADKNLVQRKAFEWTILRPGGLSNEPGTGTAAIGRTHITTLISRDDVAKVLDLLVDRPDAAGLAIDLVGGEANIEEALDKAVKNGESDFLG